MAKILLFYANFLHVQNYEERYHKVIRTSVIEPYTFDLLFYYYVPKINLVHLFIMGILYKFDKTYG